MKATLRSVFDVHESYDQRKRAVFTLSQASSPGKGSALLARRPPGTGAARSTAGEADIRGRGDAVMAERRCRSDWKHVKEIYGAMVVCRLLCRSVPVQITGGRIPRDCCARDGLVSPKQRDWNYQSGIDLAANGGKGNSWAR